MLRRALRRLSRSLPAGGGGLTVLTYHLVGASTSSPVDLPASVFRRQLSELASSGLVVSLAAGVERLARGDRSPGVAVTFDDAYDCFHSAALPLLRDLRLPATLYVPVDFVEGRGPPPIRRTEGARACSWEQLREAVSSGLVTIGSHTCSHRDLRAMTPGAARDEMERSRAVLEERLGVAIETFCYPRGEAAPWLEPLVARAYRTAVVRGGRRNTPGRFSPLRLERTPLRRDMPDSVLPVIQAPVWLEEWAATRVAGWVR